MEWRIRCTSYTRIGYLQVRIELWWWNPLPSLHFSYIFKNMSACKRLFPWIIKYEDEGVDWKKTTEFKDQALKFVQVPYSESTVILVYWQVIDTVVWGIIDGDKSEPFLYDVGQRHVQYASRGFKASYWDVFLVSIDDPLATVLLLPFRTQCNTLRISGYPRWTIWMHRRNRGRNR